MNNLRRKKNANMSAPDLNFRAQVESVLSELVKVATVELTKLFETHYQACVVSTVKGEGGNEILQWQTESVGKAVPCSIGVQFNGHQWRNETAEHSGSLNLRGRADCLKSQEEEQGFASTDTPTEEENGYGERLGLLVKENANQSPVESSFPTPPSCVKDAISHDHHRHPSCPPSSPSRPKQPPLVKAEPESEVVTEGPVEAVCPPFPKQEHQALEVAPSEAAAAPPLLRPEPQQTAVSTAQGQDCGPSPSDAAAVAPLPQVEAWECVSPSKVAAANDLQMKLKRANRGLVRPCSVQLVDIDLASKSTGAPKRVAARHKSGSSTSSSSSFSPSPPPKDLRRHQGLHTGHRLCCYTACSNGVWRLQGVVSHTRDGYPCKVCGKKFKRRKILRRHARFHTGEKPYACPRCPKSFALRKTLRRHARFHTGERPHDCSQCGKSFRLRENLKAHLRFHSGEKPYVCSICRKTFRIARNLEKHNMDKCGFLVPSFRKIAGLVG
ncbi:zinc finger protein 250 [Gadus macrocephalus]|uniref:zinc finger protein 250 n=1 Tax=Gadus macrocephalus TaxID=80720 RepID=UPI0028CBBC79|nr:zinc finger protein 250 [Gadus macrocephalus]